jgi:hypothetical protein
MGRAGLAKDEVGAEAELSRVGQGKGSHTGLSKHRLRALELTTARRMAVNPKSRAPGGVQEGNGDRMGLGNSAGGAGAGTAPLEPHLKSILLWLFWRWRLVNYLPRLDSNRDPAGHRYVTPIIPATQEAEIRRIVV